MTKRASGVSSGIFVHQDYRAVLLGINSPPQMATISECRSAWSQVPALNLSRNRT